MRLPVRSLALLLVVALGFPLMPAPVGDVGAAPVVSAPAAPDGSDAGNKEDLGISDGMQRGAGPAPAPATGDAASPSGSVVPEPVAPTSPPRPVTPPVGKELAPLPEVPTGPGVVVPEPKIGGGFDVAKSVEVMGERGEFSTVYANPDGTRTAMISQVPQYYRTGRDEWAKVVPAFEATADKGVVVADRNSFTVRADSGGVTVSTAKGREISLSVRSDKGVLGVPEITDEGGSVTYREVWPGVDVRFRIDAISVTKEIVLKSADVPLSYDLLIGGVELSQDERGDLVVDGKDADEVRVGRVELFDKSGSPIDSKGLVTSALTKRGVEGSDVAVSVDGGWLKSLPPEAFPVVVDPMVGVGIQSGFAGAWARDTGGTEFKCSVPDGFCPSVRAGNASTTGLYRWRSVFAFDYSQYLPATVAPPFNRTFTSASITLTWLSGSTAGATVYVRRASEHGWCGVFLSAAPPNYCSLTNTDYQWQTISNNAATFNVSSYVNAFWWSGAPMVGFAINGDETPGINNYKSLSATMQLDYNTVPTVTQSAPADNTWINSGTASAPAVTLTAAGADPDGGPALEYRFEVLKRLADGSWIADTTTTWSSSSSVVLPMTNGWDAAFAWRAWVRDSALAEAVSGWRYLTTTKGPTAPQGQPLIVSDTASPTIYGFQVVNPLNMSLSWKFQLCEIAPSSVCGAFSAPLAGDGWDGWWSYKAANFAQLGWTLQPGRRYVVKAYAPNETGVFDVRSQFEVSHVPPPVVSTVSEVLPDQLNSTRPTFTTPTSNGSVGFTGYYFCVNAGGTAPQTVIDPVGSTCDTHRSGWVSSSSYQLPTALNWGQIYNVRVWVRSSTGVGAPGMLKYFVTRVAIENRLRSVSLDPSTGVDAATGNFVFDRSDVAVSSPSGLLSAHRTYNSASTAVGAFGRGWSSLLDQRVQWDAAGPGIWLRLADGSSEYHGQSPGGGYNRPFGSVVDVTDWPVPSGVWLRVTDANETLFDYDFNGNLVKVTDRDGHGLIVGVRNPTTFQQTLTDEQSGRVLTITWSGNGSTDRVLTVSTQSVGGQVLTWRYGYTGDLLTQVCDPRDNTLTTGKCEKYGYTSNRLTSLTKVGRTSPSVTVGYTNGRVSTRTDALSNQFVYSAPTSVQVTPPGGSPQWFTQVSITDPRLNTTYEQYDSSNRLVHRIDRAGKHRWWEYNGEGLLAKVTDETGATESYLYDADANMTSKTNALGQMWSYTWDSTHRKLSQTSPLGVVTTYTYESTATVLANSEIAAWTADQPGVVQRTTRTERTLGTETAYGGSGLMPKGLLRRTIDPAGRITMFDYDAKGDLRRVTDPAGKVTEYVYDELGRETSQTVTWLDGDNVSTTATWLTSWTVLSQKASETEPAVLNTAASPQVTHRRKTEWLYDDRGNVTRTRELDLVGGDATRDTLFEFDALDRECRTTAPDGGVTTRTFDANSNVVTVADPLGRVYTTVYDARNLPTSVTLSNYVNPVVGGAPSAKLVRSVSYNDRGQVDVETDALGRQVKHRYDALGREYQTELVSYVKLDGSTIAPFVLHYTQFDADGRAQREDTGNGMARVDRTFDARNRVGTERLYNTGSTDRLVTYHYDPNGSGTSRTVSCVSTCSLTTLEERAVLDAVGRPVQQIVENGTTDLVTVTRYDQAGNPVAVTDPRGTANPAAPLAAFTTTTRYDVLGRVRQTVAPSTVVDVFATATNPVATPTAITGYSTYGEITHVVDANGNRTITAYDTSGRESTISHPAYTPPGGTAINASETFAYDLAGNLTSRVDRLGQTWVFEFDSFNQAVRQTAPKAAPASANPITVSGYDAVGNLTSTTDPTGAVVTYTYDNLNRQRTAVQVVRPYGTVTTTQSHTTRFDYDGLGNLIYTETPTGAITTQVYSPAGEMLQQTLPGSGAGLARTTFTYDLAGRVITTTDPLDRKTTSTYDTAGRIATTTRYAPAAAGGAALATTSYTLDQVGNTTKVTRPEGDATTYTYDARNQVRTVTETGGPAQRAWWRLGNTTGTTATDTSPNAANGTLQGTYTLNQTGAVSGSTDPAIAFAGGNVEVPVNTVTGTDKTYSVWFKTTSNGVLISKANAASGTTPTSFTPLMYVGTDGKLYAGTSPTQMISTSGVVNNNVWRRAVLLITPEIQNLYVDGVWIGSRSTTAVVDSWATKAYLATGYTAGYPATTGGWMPFTGTLDEAAVYNQPIGESLVGGQTWVQVSGSPTTTTTFSYDAAGNQTKTVDPKTNVWWTTYNTWNLPESRIEPPAVNSPVEAEVDRTFTTTYTPAGQVASERSPGAVRVDHVYDNLGQLTLSTGVGASGTRQYTYDLAGRTQTATNSSGTLTYTYDDRGLMATAAGIGGNSTFTYDGIGRVTNRVDPAGTTGFSWTPRNELYALTEPATGKILFHYYNDAQQLTSINYDNQAANAPARIITYDTTGRIATDTTRNTAFTNTLTTTYTYDRNNNTTAKTIGGAGVAGAGTNRYYYDQTNRLINWYRPDGTPNEYTYDPNGNRTRNKWDTTTYDNRNRVTQHNTTTNTWTTRGTLATSTTLGVTTTYTHNAFGEMTAAGTTSYTYDPLGRTRTRTNGTTTNFTYTGTNADPTSDGTYTYTRKPSGSPIAVAQGATKQLLNLNQHGDLTATLTTTGNTAQTIDYDPYGVTRATTGGTQPSLGYQADWTDPTTGLINMGARWYQPTTANFTTRDTYNGRLDTPITLNRYTYANNNPLRYNDPTGHYASPLCEVNCGPKPKPKVAPKPITQPKAQPNKGSLCEVNCVSPSTGLPKVSPQAAPANANVATSRAFSIAHPTPPPIAATPMAPLPIQTGSYGCGVVGCIGDYNGVKDQQIAAYINQDENTVATLNELAKDQTLMPEHRRSYRRDVIAGATSAYEANHTNGRTFDDSACGNSDPLLCSLGLVAVFGVIPIGTVACVASGLAPCVTTAGTVGPGILQAANDAANGAPTGGYHLPTRAPMIGDDLAEIATNTADDILRLGTSESWGNPNTLARHFRDHGADFAASSADDYARMASEFRQRPGTLTKIDADGVIRVYDPATNTFGSYNANGTTKTFFKPSSPTFWDRQLGSPPAGG